MDDCVTLTEKEVAGEKSICCESCSSSLNENCRCENCEPIIIRNPDIGSLTCRNLNVQRIMDCATLCQTDVAVNKISFFQLETDCDYSHGDPICIQEIGLTYDYIGLPGLLVNNSEIYIDGDLYSLTPEAGYNAGTQNRPVILFNNLSGIIKLRNPCCCDLENKPRCIRIFESGKVFDVDNLVVKIKGYIGCKPFSAFADINDEVNEESANIRLTTLGLTSSGVFDTRLCIENPQESFGIKQIFTPKLTVDCIRPVENYGESGRPGFLQAAIDFTLNIKKQIYVFSNENRRVYMYGDSIICRS